MSIKLISCLIFAVLSIPFSVFSQNLKFQEGKEGMLLLEDDKPRYFYQSLTKSKNGQYPRANYIHPLYGLQGEILTEDFPDDHLHQRGIYWAWHQLYAEGKRIGNPWLSEGILWDVQNIDTKVDSKVACLKSEILWKESSSQKAILKENLAITYKRLDKDAYSLTFDIQLTALLDVVAIGGSEDEKGYGGFSARLKLPEDVVFNSVSGKVEPENLPVQAGPWINLTGNFDPSSDGHSAIVIMGEPDKLPNYQGWILRSANSMQNMAFPGKNPVSIPKGESISFRNQILVHRNLNIQEIEEYYKEFSD